MTTPLLATKLYIPPPRPGIVTRPRLIERLNAGLALGRKVTLVSASAGFGKTTLVSEWVEELRVTNYELRKDLDKKEALATRDPSNARQVAWLALDEGDNDPVRFLVYLLSALEAIRPGIGEGLLATIQSPQPPPTEAILTTLLNRIAVSAEPLLLVLDDYHVIDAAPNGQPRLGAVDQAVAFLIEHQPPPMHLVIATREDPALPLARLRASGQLTEVRTADLRFTPAEAAEFLNRMMGLTLSPTEIAALETRTEGWIAGLQLAALSMQGRQDIAAFIQAFTGSHRFVLDYLAEEVLQHQAEPIRSFLLQTALLDRFCVALCNAVTGRVDGKALLDSLERSNLFLIALDDQRHWYRYHHLFAEVLQTHLREAQPDQVALLHGRASVWFEQHDLAAEAIQHALAAKDLERAATLIERVWLVMDLSYQSATWLGWARRLPDELIRARPVVSVGYAWALLNDGELEASEAYLRDAERWLNPAAEQAESHRMVVVDNAEFQTLPASIAAARTYRALALGDIAGTKRYARQTLALVGEQPSIHYTQAVALLGIAEYASGDLPAAEQELRKFQALMWQANEIANAIGITYVLADIKLVQGRLREALSAYRQSLQLALSRGAPAFLGASDLHRGLSELLCEQGDLEGAAQHLQTAEQLGKQGALTGWPYRLRVAQARLKEAQGDPAGALVLLEAAERHYVRNPMPDRPIAALKARTWARQGQLTAALSWVHAQQLSPDDDLSYLREFEHLTLARVLIARYQSARVADDLHAALGLLARLLPAAATGGRQGSMIEILVLQALAHHAQGDQPHALAALERALVLAEPEGYVRSFADEGEVIAALLTRLKTADGRMKVYIHTLLAAFGRPKELQPSAFSLQPLVEPLSERELEVLKLLRSELSGPEIANRLIVSLNTFRTHTKSIFSKLGVNTRQAAVRRAAELGLL